MAYNFTAINNAVVGAASTKPGHSDVVFFSPIDEFATIAVPGTYTNPGDKKKITTAHTFGVGDGFVRIKCKPGSVREEGSTVIGEKGGLVPNHVFTMIVKGHSAVIEEILEEALNIEAIWIFNSPECGVNEYVQLGSSCSPAQLTGYEVRSGSRQEGGVREYQITLESFDKYWYSGALTEKA